VVPDRRVTGTASRPSDVSAEPYPTPSTAHPRNNLATAGNTFEVSSVDEAREVLDYFNGFHDGFMKRIAIVSQDDIDEEYAQSCSGRFDVEIDFAHYNYRFDDRPPHDQIVRAVFRDVQDLFCDFSEGYVGNTIQCLYVHAANRRQGGTTTVEPAMVLSLERSFLLEQHRRWESRRTDFFSFSAATFSELR
jgi:hypothetical protein